MNYYQYDLPNTNVGLRSLKRAFLILAAFNFVTGLTFIVLASCVNWRFVFLPLAWFLLGFVYGNVAYIFVTDYRYVYEDGELAIYKHRKYGNYRLVVKVPVCDMDWDATMYAKKKVCTNCPANLSFVYQDVLYTVTVDDYMTSLVKGETNVS